MATTNLHLYMNPETRRLLEARWSSTFPAHQLSFSAWLIYPRLAEIRALDTEDISRTRAAYLAAGGKEVQKQ